MQQVQFIICGMIFCHFTPRKPDDLKSWFRTQIHLQHSCKVLFNLCLNSSSSFYFWLHSFWSIWIWILWSKIRFFIPFHRNLILDCNLNDPPLEADHSDWYLGNVYSIWPIDLSIAFLVWLHELLIKSLKVTSTQRLPSQWIWILPLVGLDSPGENSGLLGEESRSTGEEFRFAGGRI